MVPPKDGWLDLHTFQEHIYLYLLSSPCPTCCFRTLYQIFMCVYFLALTHFIIPFHEALHFMKSTAFPQCPGIAPASSPTATMWSCQTPVSFMGVLISPSLYSILRRRHLGDVPHPQYFLCLVMMTPGQGQVPGAHGFSNTVEPMGLGHQEWHRPGSVVRSAEACGKLESTDPTERRWPLLRPSEQRHVRSYPHIPQFFQQKLEIQLEFEMFRFLSSGSIK